MSVTHSSETVHPKTEIRLTTDGGDEACVSPIGGLFTITLHATPILIPVIRGDGKSIRTHICTPNFGKDHSGVFDLKQHGSMRSEPCSVVLDNSRILIQHEIIDSPHVYPSGISVSASIALKDGESIVTIHHENKGKIAAPINCGIHCYFHAPESYRNTHINGCDVTKLVENTGHIDLKEINTISIPGMPVITMKQSGLSKGVLWVGENSKGEKDTNYVCIEPIEFLPEEFNSTQTLIQPLQSRTTWFSLKLS
jgi:galactose mutarotase-like enzyme